MRFNQIFTIEDLACILPELGFKRTERQMSSVLCLIDIVAGVPAGQSFGPALRLCQIGQISGERDEHESERVVHHRNIDHLALAGTLTRLQRQQNANDRTQTAAGQIRQLNAGNLWRSSLLAIYSKQSCDRNVVDVMAGFLTVRAILSISSERAVDQAWIDPAQRLVSDAQPVHYSGSKPLHYDIGLLDHFKECFTTCRMFQIDRDAAFIAICDEEVSAGVLDSRARVSHRIASARLLDLDDLGSKISEHHRRHRSRQQSG